MDYMSVSNNRWAGDYFKHGHTKIRFYGNARMPVETIRFSCQAP